MKGHLATKETTKDKNKDKLIKKCYGFFRVYLY